jgi:hypothetical protein
VTGKVKRGEGYANIEEDWRKKEKWGWAAA